MVGTEIHLPITQEVFGGEVEAIFVEFALRIPNDIGIFLGSFFKLR